MNERKQVWFCLNCCRCGEVTHRLDADAYTVAQALGDAHWKSSEMRCPSSPRIVADQRRARP